MVIEMWICLCVKVSVAAAGLFPLWRRFDRAPEQPERVHRLVCVIVFDDFVRFILGLGIVKPDIIMIIYFE